uniref:Non-specific protein-tyrosine kinase n=1 Tax=Angiostrongylus cantonensis TaxID=6313 RepID=A0A0K0DPM6_ANGCA
KNELPTGSEPDNEAVDTGCNSLVLRLNETDYKEKIAKDRRDKLFCLVDQTMEKMLADLEKENWYHGCLPFEDIVGLLKMDGDFLVRELEPEGERMAMVPSSGIPLIRKHHYQNAIPIDGDVLLKNPIPKQKWELSSEKITMDTKIGSGQFGEVWKGTMKEDAKKPPVIVAIKVITSKDKIGYAIDAAVGMAYLHSKGCIHRDIACRNCLIDVKKSIVKISDFGLSKQVEVYKIQAHERLPIRWQAPEVISTRIYTAKCDVYSYGILLWEIFNNGEQPFRGMSNKIIKSKICDPKFRPPVDPTLPIVIQRVMRTCWRADPKKRPMMAQVARFLIHAPAEM